MSTNIPNFYLRDCATGEDEKRIIYGLAGRLTGIPKDTDASPPVQPANDDAATEPVLKL